MSIFHFFLYLFRTNPEQNCEVDLFCFPLRFLSCVWYCLSTGTRACPWSCFSIPGDGFTLIHPHCWPSVFCSHHPALFVSRPVSVVLLLPWNSVKWTVPWGDFTPPVPDETQVGLLFSQPSFPTLLTNHRCAAFRIPGQLSVFISSSFLQVGLEGQNLRRKAPNDVCFKRKA